MIFLGWLMLIAPFALAFIYLYKTEAPKVAYITFATLGALLLWFYLSFDMIKGG